MKTADQCMTSENSATVHVVIALATLAVVVLVLLEGCFAYPHEVRIDREMAPEYIESSLRGVEWAQGEGWALTPRLVSRRDAMVHERGVITVRLGGNRCRGEMAGKAGLTIWKRRPRGAHDAATIYLCKPSSRVVAHELMHAVQFDEHSRWCESVRHDGYGNCEEWEW